jgi:cytoskeletal protein CcmA (bactofilin family)
MFDVKDIDLYDYGDDDFDTIMARDIVFKGAVRFAKPMMIRGVVSGTIETTSDLVIDSNALVHSNITADRVLVRGTVEGNISAKRLIAVMSDGSVTGDIRTAQIVLELGSSFSGNCAMIRGEK